MTTYYPIVIETEASGAVSAFVPGLPVFAAANTRTKAELAILETLAARLRRSCDVLTARSSRAL